MYLDYAEDQARRHTPMHMADWIKKLDAFLRFNERNILKHAGRISQEMAEERAIMEFEKFEVKRLQREAQQPTSDFDRFLEKIKKIKSKSVKALPEGKKTSAKAKRKEIENKK